MSEINLAGLSADALDALARRAASLAADLRKSQPSYDLALSNGVIDAGYNTVRYGLVSKYAGEAVVTMADGSRWRCVGHGPQGSAEHISKHGYIEFIPIAPDRPSPERVAQMIADRDEYNRTVSGDCADTDNWKS